MTQRSKLVFTGSGGQGVITAAIILAEAAVLHEHLKAVQTQVYGAAARGGATRTDVIISDTEIYYPKVNQPNVLVCLTREAYTKFSPIIRPGGLLITDTRYVKIEPNVDAIQKELPIYYSVMEKIGKPIVFNLCMLGAVMGLTEVVRLESLHKILESRIPPAFLEMNRTALNLGYEIGKAALVGREMAGLPATSEECTCRRNSTGH